MKNNKIDKYFKQKLNVPQQPPEDAWNFIQSRIPEEKEKKRILPFWIRLSGIAAALVLTMGIGYWLGTANNSNATNPQYVVNPVNSVNHPSQKDSRLEESNIKSNSDYPVTDHEMMFVKVNNGHISYDSYNQNYTNNNHRPSNDYIEFADNDYLNDSHIHQNNPVALLNSTVFSNANSPWHNSNLTPENSISLPESKDLKSNKNNEFLLTKNVKTKEEKEKKKKKNIAFDRFHISAFASPLAFNTFVGNSMLADEMSEYRTDNNITLAYGVKAAYSLTPRLKVRTGVSIVGLEQITHDVPLAVEIGGVSEFASVDKINNINYLGNVRIDNYPIGTSLVDMEMNNRTGYGDIQQQASYIEIPVEAELSLFQTNSIGISATGGGSTWVLSKNKIYVHTDDYTQQLGEANNLNNVAFSANAGLKFDMNLTEAVKLNVEPNFKYLFNPVSNIEKYNPYTVGVNAGISISLK